MARSSILVAVGLSLGIVLLPGSQGWAFSHHDLSEEHWKPFSTWKPKLDFDAGWDKEWGSSDWDSHGTSKWWFLGKGWDDEKGHGGKHGWKGYDKYDPDCDPPVATPEPATLLLFGASMAGVAVARKLKRKVGA